MLFIEYFMKKNGNNITMKNENNNSIDKNTALKEIISWERDGKRSNLELLAVVDKVGKTASTLHEMGDKFYLAFKETNSIFIEFADFCLNRKILPQTGYDEMQKISSYVMENSPSRDFINGKELKKIVENVESKKIDINKRDVVADFKSEFDKSVERYIENDRIEGTSMTKTQLREQVEDSLRNEKIGK